MRNIRLAGLYVPLALSVSGCADLVVTDVHHEPFIAKARQIKTTVKNDGWRDAPASKIRLDVKPANSATFTRYAEAATPALTRGQQIELPISTLQSSELPAAGSGQCLELRVCADVENTVSEGWLWEGNNCLTRSFCN